MQLLQVLHKLDIHKLKSSESKTVFSKVKVMLFINSYADQLQDLVQAIEILGVAYSKSQLLLYKNCSICYLCCAFAYYSTGLK